MYLTTSDGRRIEFNIQGDGPGLLLPECNARWNEFGYVDKLAERYRVVTASPRGYFGSDWEESADAYTLNSVRDDLLAAADAAGLETFSVWGYSLAAAVGAFLAAATSRVRALVAGGFPLIGSYQAVVEWAEQLPVPTSPPCDPAAVIAFYRAMAAANSDERTSSLRCARCCYWGADDPIMTLGMPIDQQRRHLEEAGFVVQELPGLDHVACGTRTDLAVPIIARFLAQIATV
jgi:pimeloyl-ACP methyl ester carboxylesterase